MFNKETQMWDWPFPDVDMQGSWHNIEPSYEVRIKEITASVNYWFRWLIINGCR